MRFLPFKMALKALVIDQPYHSKVVSKMIEKLEEDSMFYKEKKTFSIPPFLGTQTAMVPHRNPMVVENKSAGEALGR